MSDPFVRFVRRMPSELPVCPSELRSATDWSQNDSRKDISMKLRIDTAGVSFVCTRAPEQRLAFDTGQPRMDRETGLPLWQVQLMALDSSGGDVIAVTVAGDPNVTVGQPAQVDGLVALPWSQEGRSGIAFRADAIRASGAPLAGVIAAPRTATPSATPGNTGKPAA
jgi:hypothetical protein